MTKLIDDKLVGAWFYVITLFHSLILVMIILSWGNTAQDLGAYRAISNNSNSMCLDYTVSDKFFSESEPLVVNDSLILGGVYIYKDHDGTGSVIHRLVGLIQLQNGTEAYLFKGDCNERYDQPVYKSDITYKVIRILSREELIEVNKQATIRFRGGLQK